MILFLVKYLLLGNSILTGGNKMKRFSFIIILLLISGILMGSPAQGVSTDETKKADPEPLNEQLLPLKPFIGKTWRGVLKDSTPEKPMVDVSHWERALNGQAVRVLHSLNNGMYGGETIIMWDPQKESLVFFYFTTAGFFTQGTIKFEMATNLSMKKTPNAKVIFK
jgi:hypothetical protein